MLLNYGTGEDSSESLELQGDPTSELPVNSRLIFFLDITEKLGLKQMLSELFFFATLHGLQDLRSPTGN